MKSSSGDQQTSRQGFEPLGSVRAAFVQGKVRCETFFGLWGFLPAVACVSQKAAEQMLHGITCGSWLERCEGRLA